MYQNVNVKSQLKLSLPIGFENLVNVLMSLVDALVVANLGATELAALGAMIVIISLLQMAGQTINVSNNALVSKALGEGNTEKVKLITGNAVILTAISSLVLIILTFLISPLLPGLFKVSRISLTYLYIRLVAFFQNSIVTVLSGHQRTIGNQKNILHIRIWAVIFNLLLNILVINLKFGIAGVAAVTATIDTILAIYLVIYSRKTMLISYNKKYFYSLSRLFKWNFVERVISKVDNFFFNLIVANMGTNEYAVHVILLQIASVYEAFMSGFGDGITINVGVALGKSIKEFMQNVKTVAKKLINIFSIIIPILVLIVSFIIMHISLKQPELKIIFIKVVPLFVLGSYITMSATYYFSILRGYRDFKFLALRNLFSSILKIVSAYILSFTSLGIIGVWIGYIIYNLSQKYQSKFRYFKLKLNE